MPDNGLQRADADLVMQRYRDGDSGSPDAFPHDGATSALSNLLESVLGQQGAKLPA